MITILTRHNLNVRAEEKPFEEIEITDFRLAAEFNEEANNIIVFVEKSDEVSDKFNYKELKNRFEKPYTRKLISGFKLGEYLAEITENDLN